MALSERGPVISFVEGKWSKYNLSCFPCLWFGGGWKGSGVWV